VDIEKTCVDAESPADPISFEVTVTNCGDVRFYCVLEDLDTHEILADGELAPGQDGIVGGSYFPDECGESTNRVKVTCWYEIVQGTSGGLGVVYDEDSATCSVPCDGEAGCTLTPGYWKTHSIYGPAPHDPTWALIGEDTPFFLSAQSYYEVLWTEPRGGNAYYILARAYIAARLNVLAGASVPSDVETVLNSAADLFGTYTPEYIGGLGGDNDLRKRFVRMAAILDDYNNGLTGPGDCDDDGKGDGGVCIGGGATDTEPESTTAWTLEIRR
jgi:hypothetical protein